MSTGTYQRALGKGSSSNQTASVLRRTQLPHSGTLPLTHRLKRMADWDIPQGCSEMFAQCPCLWSVPALTARASWTLWTEKTRGSEKWSRFKATLPYPYPLCLKFCTCLLVLKSSLAAYWVLTSHKERMKRTVHNEFSQPYMLTITRMSDIFVSCSTSLTLPYLWSVSTYHPLPTEHYLTFNTFVFILKNSIVDAVQLLLPFHWLHGTFPSRWY